MRSVLNDDGGESEKLIKYEYEDCGCFWDASGGD